MTNLQTNRPIPEFPPTLLSLKSVLLKLRVHEFVWEKITFFVFVFY